MRDTGPNRSRAAYALLTILALTVVLSCAGTRRYRDDSLGSKLFYSRCRSCHAPVDPASKSAGFWGDYLDRHAERAQLTEAERDSVHAFVLRATASSQE